MSSEAGPEVDEMNELISEAERKAVESHQAHTALLAAFKKYLAGKALGKEYVEPMGRVIPGDAE